MNAGKILKVERIKEITLPPGKYTGMWSGYQIKINLDNGMVIISTEKGIRGCSGCVVTVTGTGQISADTTDHIPLANGRMSNAGEA